VDVGLLPGAAVIEALEAGAAAAQAMTADGRAIAAHLVLQGETHTVGTMPAPALGGDAKSDETTRTTTGLDQRRRAWPR
jgi:hypothetical protein